MMVDEHGRETNQQPGDAAAALEMLEHISGAAQSHDIPRILRLALHLGCSQLNWPIAHAYLVDNAPPHGLVDSGQWYVRENSGLAGMRGRIEPVRLAPGQGLAGRVFNRRVPMWLAEIEDEDVAPSGRPLGPLGHRAALGVPVLVAGKVVAVLEFFADRRLPEDPLALRMMRLLAGQVSRVFERERAVEAIDPIRRLLAVYMDCTPMAVITWDMNQLVTGWNKAAFTMFGHGEQDALGRPLGELVIPDGSRDTMAEMTGALLSNRGGTHVLMEVRGRAGQHIQGEWFNAMLRDGDGAPLGGASLIQDVTDLRKATEALSEIRQEAVQLGLAHVDFLMSLGAALRPPLVDILDRARALVGRDNGENQTEGHEIADRGDRLLRLVDQFKELVDIETGHMAVEVKSAPLGPIVRDSLGDMADRARDMAITIDNGTTEHDAAAVKVDPVLLRKVLGHLLSNAIKYNRDGGYITLTSETPDENTLRLSVVDTGIGIAADQRDKLFQPFHRLGQEKTPIPGTGLGLALARQLMRLMKGDVGYQNMEGKGSRFWIRLPLAAPLAPRPAGEPTSRLSGDLHHVDAIGDGQIRHKVLYVEDNPVFLSLMTKIVATIPNVDMISAHSAELGLALAQSRKPEVILMDINLPGMDGYTALARLRKMEETAEIPVIAVSGMTGAEDVAKGLGAGFEAYLTKPINPQATVEALRKALSGRSL